MRWGRKEEPVPGTEGGWVVIGSALAGTEAAVDGIERERRRGGRTGRR